MVKTNMFTDGNGVYSMRRGIAFAFAIDTIVQGYFCKPEDDWKVVLIKMGLPLIGSILMLLFTSWTDLATVIKAARTGE